MTLEKNLYERVYQLGDGVKGRIHIIDVSCQYKCVGEGEYRIYGAGGHCFDIAKKYVCEPDEISDYLHEFPESDGYNYSFYSWDGFQSITLSEAIELLSTID